MNIKSLCVGAIALIQATSFSGSAMDSEVEIQKTAVGFSIEVGPGGGGYYGPYYDPYGPCYGPGGIYLGPGCPRYYYGPNFYHGRGRRYHRRRGRHHRRRGRHRGRRGRRGRR